MKTKSEIRSPKSERNPRPEIRRTASERRPGFRVSAFGLLSGFGFRRAGFVLGCLLLAIGFGAPLPVHAVLPEPSNVLFGTITISNLPAGPERTDLVIEARRMSNGPAIASYRVGDAVEHGDVYFLEIPVETATVNRSTNATAPGSTIYIALRDETGDLALLSYQVIERGRFQRTDFNVSPILDNNGLPDPWELANFGVAGQNPNGDPDGDGRSNLQEYLAGTDPNAADSFQLTIAPNASQVLVSFFARRAEGPGYEGKARYYSLETSTNLNASPWLPVAGFTNIFGNNQTVVYTTARTNRARFYRGKAVLP